MGLWTDFVAHCKHARDHVERARDPETHLPIPQAKPAGMWVKLGAWALGTKYGTKFKLAVFSAVLGSVSAFCLKHGAGEVNTVGILGGVTAVLTWVWERFVSIIQNAARGTPPVVGGQSLVEKASSYAPYKMAPVSFQDEPLSRPEIPILPRMARAQDDTRESFGLPRREPAAAPRSASRPAAAVPSFRVAFAEAGEDEWHEKTFENLAGAIAFRDKQRMGGNQAKLL